MLKKLVATMAVTAVVAFAAAGQGFGTPRAPYTYHGPVVLPDSGVLFGVHLKLDSHNGTNRQQAMLDFEALVQRPMAIDREFYLWDDTWPTSDDTWSAQGGRILYFSWDAIFSDGTCALWADIANGVYDAKLDTQAAALKAFAYPAIFSFHHEPSTAPPGGGSCGTSTDYQNAWRHVHDRFVADGVTNLTYALTLTALTYQKNKADIYYPGDDVIDVVAADGYNWFGCPYHPGPWREFSDIFDSFYQYAVTKGKPAVMAEYGSGEDDSIPGRKAQWFTNTADTLKGWPLVKGVSYFNVGGGCARYVDTSPTSLAAYQALGHDPFTNPPIPVKAVTVQDFSFTPPTITSTQGYEVKWTNNGPSTHTVTDNSGMGLYDSGDIAPGSTYQYFYLGAGSYRYHCTIHTSMTGVVKVPALASPPSGGINTTFTITWAADYAPTNFAFDVQIKRPGSTKWANWLAAQTVDSSTFVPDGGTGTYQFRARLHDTTTDEKSGYSDPVSIIVS